MPLKIVRAKDEAELAGLFSSGWHPSDEVTRRVSEIVADVRSRGDAALVEYTRRFDAPAFEAELIRVPLPSLAEARSLVPEEIAAGLTLARARVAAFHERQIQHDARFEEDDGTVSAFLVRPLALVGAYVPSGSAALPSSVIMTVVPAKIAGVERVVVVTPPGRDGIVHPAIRFACSLCGADELYAAGGAQAIAALAYGTQSVPAVDKIVGPGNVWVTEAKRQVFGACGIDGLAGPSEVLVVADEGARADYVAGELLAQAEHDPLARVAVVSRSRELLQSVAALLDGDLARGGRDAIVAAVLERGTYLIEADDEAETLTVIERFAPEHLSLQVADPWQLVPKIRRAGAIFVGEHTPVAAGDYIAGSNHVLPTSGAARFSSGLRAADFYRTMSLVSNSAQRMRADAEILEALARFEGLPAHARTAMMRASSGEDESG